MDEKEQARMEAMFQQLSPPAVPSLLTDKINERIRRAEARRRRHKTARRGTIAVASAIVLLAGSVMLSPSVATYAKQVPGLSVAVTWLESTGELLGIFHAKEQGYIPIEPFRKQWGQNVVTVDNLYYEEDQLFYTITIQGPGIAEEKANPELYEKLFYREIPPFSDSHYQSPNFTMRELVQKQLPPVGTEKEPNNVLTLIGSTWISLKELQTLYPEGTDRKLTFVVERIDRSQGTKPVVDRISLEVPFDIDRFKPTRIVDLNQNIAVNDPVIERLSIRKLKLTPTLMELEIDTRLNENGVVSLISPIPFDPDAYNHMRLEDEDGNRYPLGASSPAAPPVRQTTSLWSFLPSLYFEEQPQNLKLHIDRIWVSSIEIEDVFNLSMHKPFPQTTVYKGKRISVLEATYKAGYLYLDVKADDNGDNPWAGALLTYEPYFLKLQQLDGEHRWWEKAGLDIHTPEVERIPETANQLARRYSALSRGSKSYYSTFGELGLVSDNFDRRYNETKQASYEIRIMAPKLEEYPLSIRRYGDPVDVNQTISIPVPSGKSINAK